MLSIYFWVPMNVLSSIGDYTTTTKTIIITINVLPTPIITTMAMEIRTNNNDDQKIKQHTPFSCSIRFNWFALNARFAPVQHLLCQSIVHANTHMRRELDIAHTLKQTICANNYWGHTNSFSVRYQVYRISIRTNWSQQKYDTTWMCLSVCVSVCINCQFYSMFVIFFS